MAFPATRGPFGRVLALAVGWVVPWTIVLTDGGIGLVFPWGLVNPGTGHVTTITAYVFVLTRGLPGYLLAWPIAVVLYAGASLSWLAGFWRREDPRVTGGLVVLTGLSLLVFVRGIGRPPSVAAVPVGTVVLWVLAWWAYWPAIREAEPR